MSDPLVDRDCVLLDGSCYCKYPYLECKFLENNNKIKTEDLDRLQFGKVLHKRPNEES